MRLGAQPSHGDAGIMLGTDSGYATAAPLLHARRCNLAGGPWNLRFGVVVGWVRWWLGGAICVVARVTFEEGLLGRASGTAESRLTFGGGGGGC